jgi:hypothetical protein
MQRARASNGPFTVNPNVLYLGCMTVVRFMLGRTRSLMRKAAVLLAGTQLVLGGAPLLESGAKSASAHVESKGIQLHHAHDEASCIACTAHRILGGADPVQPPLVNAAARLTSHAPEIVTRAVSRRSSLKRSRAPPAPVLS